MRVIHVLRKPLSESTVAANTLKHGTGGLNIDASRIRTGEDTTRPLGRSAYQLRDGSSGSIVVAGQEKESLTRTRRKYNPAPEAIAAFLKEHRTRAGLSMAEVDAALGTNTAYSWWEGRKGGIQLPSPEHWTALKALLGFPDTHDEVMTTLVVEEKERVSGGHGGGRWPANLILEHDPGCEGGCVPGCPVLSLDEQTANRLHLAGNKKSSGAGAGKDYEGSSYHISYLGQADRDQSEGDTTTGASRFYKQVGGKREAD